MGQNDVQKVGSVFVYAEDLGRFDFGTDHPFKPERAIKTYELCNRYGVLGHPWMRTLEPSPINPELLTLFHDTDYLKRLEEASQGKVSLEILERGIGTEDNPIIADVYDWALRVTGGTHTALQQLMDGNALVAFNPLGGFHHGMPDHAEGFCFINDIAVAVKACLDNGSNGSGKKIAYIDIDAHHGNGVQEAFYQDPRVLVVSLHETGESLYPWSGNETETGEGRGKGFTVNVPLAPGTDDQVFGFAFDAVVPPIVRAFSPDILVAEIGADTLISDPLTHMKLTNNGYQKAIGEMRRLCPKILALGGGGYDLYRTARCWTLAWSILNQVEPTDEFAGLVGGMMFGPEMEVGSLYDRPYQSEGEVKDKALKEAHSVISHIQKEVFPIHGV